MCLSVCVNQIAATLRVAGLLAQGLRKDFSHHVKQLLPFVVHKLKEKNRIVQTEVLRTLDGFLLAAPWDAFNEEVRRKAR